MKTIVITDNEAGQRLDKFLSKYMKSAPTSFRYKMLRKKNIVLNKKRANGHEILAVGDVVSLFISDETITSFQPENLDSEMYMNQIDGYRKAYQRLKGIQIIYEDDDAIIANKPAGVLSQKANNEDISVNEWLIGYMLSVGLIDEENLKTFKPSICNRLDRNTSGMICCAKSLRASRAISMMLKDRTMHKFYRCLIEDKCTVEGLVTSYLYKDKQKNKVMIYKDLESIPIEYRKLAFKIMTRIEVVSEENKQTELEIELITGKSHQIRAQLAALQMPLIGDRKYGNTEEDSRQMLHCYRMEFPDELELLPLLRGRIITCEPPWRNSLTKEK